ncbi:RNA N6-adenosine-methyltransferase mettl16-like [Zophobas morio]|uniref:RNA N6-adenosine-methyltransferase mettl16-like n=1 Tax=Zophobas morio TaxID=2755281 RepID=UPI003082DB83
MCTGASCIYPLLGSKLFGWHFRASDRCAKLALKNVTANKLENRISLVLVDEDDPPLLKLVDQANRYHFCVCNPPFFNSKEEQESTHLRQTKPLSDNPGKEHEAVTRGGELEFIEKLLQDSLTLKKTIIWYTSLVGKKRSFLSIVKRLKGLREVTTIKWTQFTQGKTTRWAVAWSFYAIYIDEERMQTAPTALPAKRFKSTSEENKEVLKTTQLLLSVASGHKEELLDDVRSIFKEYELKYNLESALLQLFKVEARTCTWSRRARRKKKRLSDFPSEPKGLPPSDFPIFIALFQILRGDDKSLARPLQVTLWITLLRGDFGKFVSFELHFARALEKFGKYKVLNYNVYGRSLTPIKSDLR